MNRLAFNPPGSNTNPNNSLSSHETKLTGRAAIAETHLPAVAMPATVAKFKAAHPHHFAQMERRVFAWQSHLKKWKDSIQEGNENNNMP